MVICFQGSRYCSCYRPPRYGMTDNRSGAQTRRLTIFGERHILNHPGRASNANRFPALRISRPEHVVGLSVLQGHHHLGTKWCFRQAAGDLERDGSAAGQGLSATRLRRANAPRVPH
jgi:hypothetical protein